MYTILVVDDDPEIGDLLRDYLRHFQFEVHLAADAAQMRRTLSQGAIDLVVLDVMLPGSDGFVLAREIRDRSRIPVIMLTARTSTYDRVMGLESGADDYVSKPFEPRELVARIQSVLRRTKDGAHAASIVQSSDCVCFDGWSLHRQDRTVTSPEGVTIALSNAEFRLLAAFLKNPRRLLSRDQLMEQARGRSMDAFERSIDLLVSRLRHKLSDSEREHALIKTVRGAGYMFNVQSVQDRMAWQA